MSTDTASREEAVLEAMGRSAVYAYLAAGFSHPDEALLSMAETMPRRMDGELGGRLDEMRRLSVEAGLPALRVSYMRVFDPRRPPDPLEGEHRADHFQQRTLLLSDLMGFYRAFGATPDRERADNIACELDFLNLLSRKEAHALRQGSEEKARICADARAKFLKEHLLCWYEEVLDLVRGHAAEPQDRFYLALADALETVMRLEEGNCE